MNKKELLKVTGLCKNFGGVKAVDNVSFTLYEGESIGVIGPNGSGKSTLINLITGFLKPDSGTVLYKGKNITGIAPYKAVNIGIARSFQMVRPFYNMEAYKNLIVPLYSPRVKKQLKGGSYGDRDEVAIQLLEDVGFERESQIPYKMTGSLPHGYLKRLELARVLSLEPDLVVLDELFSGMSMSEVASTVPILERILKEGRNMIMIEHRIRELFRIVNKIICLNFGKKIAEGTPVEVMQMKEVKEAYLGSEADSIA
ncbi:MAG TPA: ABC transporter ATP-binding protein [Firmicutes bacterium]|nr:ABC transporter ATP-binding protein [Bacillota bacterium]